MRSARAKKSKLTNKRGILSGSRRRAGDRELDRAAGPEKAKRQKGAWKLARDGQRAEKYA